MKQFRVLLATLTTAALALIFVYLSPVRAFDLMGELKKQGCPKACEQAEAQCLKRCTKDFCKKGCSEGTKKCQEKCAN